MGYADTETGAWHAVSWTQAGGMVDLGTLGGTTSRAVAVNDGGQVVGWAETAAGQTHAFSWTEGDGMIDLGELGFGQGSGAVGLNDRSIVDLRFPPVLHFNPGQVAGTSHGGTMSHAFSWTENSGMVDLGTLAGPGVRQRRSAPAARSWVSATRAHRTRTSTRSPGRRRGA